MLTSSAETSRARRRAFPAVQNAKITPSKTETLPSTARMRVTRFISSSSLADGVRCWPERAATSSPIARDVRRLPCSRSLQPCPQCFGYRFKIDAGAWQVATIARRARLGDRARRGSSIGTYVFSPLSGGWVMKHAQEAARLVLAQNIAILPPRTNLTGLLH